MKKNYVTPEVEKIEFKYRDQVVTASSGCRDRWVDYGDNSCDEGNKHFAHVG